MSSPFSVLAAFSMLAVIFLSYGYSSGVANFSNLGQTGAPNGDGDLEGTCGVCHFTGDFGEPQIDVRFDDAPLTQYVPGRTYSVSVAVSASRNQPTAYGFQSQFLAQVASEPITAGTLDSAASNVRFSDGRFSRRYAEHSLASADNTFRFQWTAPPVGTGPVAMYVVGNTVNLGGSVSDDNGSVNPTIVALGEGQPTSIRSLPEIPLLVFPNPTVDNWILRLVPPAGGDFSVQLFDTKGRSVYQRTIPLTAAAQQIMVPGMVLPAGLYTLRISNGSALTTRKIIKTN